MQHKDSQRDILDVRRHIKIKFTSSDPKKFFYTLKSQTLGKVIAPYLVINQLNQSKYPFQDIISGQCLVYSFGVGDNYSFELAMAEMGCKVRAFDVMEVIGEEFHSHPNISFKKVGLYGKKSQIK